MLTSAQVKGSEQVQNNLQKMTNSDDTAAGAAAIGAEYASSLADLTVNSKPLINMLTILAEENERFAGTIVKAIETHLAEVAPDAKLPVLYLIDSIVKNVKGAYLPLFTQCIVNLFCGVFEKVNERVRTNMYKLRQTWGEVFPQIKLYALDCRVNCIDPAWPITARPPTGGSGALSTAAAAAGSATIHVNPNFLRTGNNAAAIVAEDSAAALMKQQLMSKQHELLILERKKLELQLLATRKVLEEQERELKRKGGEITGNSLDKSKDVTPKIAVSNDSASHKSTSQANAVSVSKPITTSSSSVNTTGVRIAPVSSELIQATRRCRDPRLARQLEQQQQSQLSSSTNTLSSTTKANVNPNNVFDLSVNIFNKSNTNTKPDLSVDYSNNSNKRFANNSSTRMGKKVPPISVSNVHVNSKFIDSKNNTKSSTKSSKSSDSLRSNKSNKQSSSQSDKKSQKSNVLSSGVAKSVKKNRDSSNSSSSGGSVQKDKSPRKSNSDNSGGLSPTKKTSSRSESVKIKSPKSSAKHNRRIRSNSDDDDDGGKGAPNSRSGSSRDVDLRVLAPPEKQPRIQRESSETKENQTTKDLDLRPSIPPTAIPGTKKRISPEKQGQPAVKRLKSGTFDVLFGNEDVDLRKPIGQASSNDSQASPKNAAGPGSPPSNSQFRVESPPPPPIISKKSDDEDEEKDEVTPRKIEDRIKTGGETRASSGGANVKGDSWAKVKVSPAITPATPDKVLPSGTQLSNFEAVRAKLAEATKTKDKLGRPLLFGNKNRDRKLFGDSEDDKPKMRLPQSEFETDSQDGMEDNLKIIMSQAQEQISNGSINPAQYNTLLKQLVQINENKKLQEAQRRESMGKSKQSKGNSGSLTPISDDELDVDEEGMRSPQDDFIPRTEPSLSDTLLSIQANSRMNKRQNQLSIGTPLLRRDRFGNLKPDTRFANRVPAPPIVGPSMERPWKNPAWDNNWARDGGQGAPVRHAGPGLLPLPTSRRNPNWQNFPTRNAVARYEMPYTRSKMPLKLGALNVSLPPAPYQLIQYINRDTMKSINIDRIPRMIRFYEDDTAVALMNWDDPREIGFQDGSRRICIDNRDTYVLHFNSPYIPVSLNGVTHQIKFGSPTRELYIDGKFYEGYFGGAPLLVPIDNKMVTIKMEGPPPQVRLGDQRTDLVAGQITLLVDAQYSHPIFLDAKPQKVEIDNETITIRFTDMFQTVLINELPFQVEFGGLPKSILVKDRKHFIRFTKFPRGVKPGQIGVRNMGSFTQPYIDMSEFEMPSQSDSNVSLLQPVKQMPIMPPTGMPMFNMPPPMSLSGDIPRVPDMTTTTVTSSLPSTTIPSLLDLPPPLLTLPPPNITTTVSSMNELTDTTSGASLDPSSGYQMEISTSSANSPALEQPIVITDENSQESSSANANLVAGAGGPVLPPTINVNDLFEKLVASGILQGVAVATNNNKKAVSTKDKSEEKVIEKPEEVAKPVSFARPETLKIRQQIFISNLYKGMQCSSCGTRFPPEQTMKYSQHLDWHFRQNRRDRDSTRRPFSRKWYYDVSDWVQYEEIEDLEEREKNWFDTQMSQQQSQANSETTNRADGTDATSHSDSAPSVAPNVTAGPEDRDARCVMCHDRFDQFYDEEKEEWCLRNAVRVDGVAYHPVCYDDYKASLEAAEMEKQSSVEQAGDEKVDIKNMKDDAPKEEDDDKIIILEDEPEEDVVEQDVTETTVTKEAEPMDVSERAQSPNKDEMILDSEENTQNNEMSKDDKDDKAHEDDDDDDVHIHEEPVELVVLNDDEDEPQFEEIGMLVKIKEEPISDNEDEIDPEVVEEYAPRMADNTQQSVISTIDGNVELEPTPAATSIGLNKIRINISTSNSSSHQTNGPEQTNSSNECANNVSEKEKDENDANKQNAKLKEALRGIELKMQEPVSKGSELSGLCCIM